MTRPALIGDIGGTNARFALVTPDTFEPHDILSLSCADYPTLVDAVRDYLARVGHGGKNAPREACLAFACPVHDDQVRMTNNAWVFSKRDVQTKLDLTLFKVINDFTAQALGVPHVAAQDLVPVGEGQAADGCARLVIGPGTGLGVAGIFPGQHAWVPLPTEGGHVTFAPIDEREQNLLRYFRSRYGRVSVERILCGQGLLDLYCAHASLKGANPRYATPAEVTTAANEGDAVAVDTVLRFLKILGDVCGDAALTMGARGGVYLCGGILPRLLDWLPRSRFRDAFADKGRMSAYNAGIPTWVVTAPWAGLLGAAEALHNEEVA
ncbi:glucokinase [Litchfieldella anticariensis FP35 = DSM 16096]|uniref:Glucokinase n=1 Tax=Litchfieldella anticariensis (strain DSM 16096 / CECT 5854 / CIP 108499 / LMG 22089 / FP35) TaxID=1121939 RepID=S2KGW2_LITA3|nr:glucokinase [Halomonas anticariensis]EPC01190.1 glucokinase [Halomonas anticariensis FP35 = DSM 16096]